LLLPACQGGGDQPTGEPAGSTSTTGSTGGTTGAPTSTTSTTGEPGSTGASFGDPFSVTILDKAWISGESGWDTQHKDIEFDLGPATFKKVTLVVDLESDCFPWEKWQQNPPPQGQNWPASCDAFDRTMGFIVDPAADPGDPPGFELLRSITPFGGPAHLEVDITDWANVHPGGHVMRSYINSWPDGQGQVSGSKGGWHLGVRVDAEPGPAPRNVLAAISLYQGEYTADTPAPTVPFELPEGVTEAEIEYRVSGHGGATDNTGGCIGPAEEFCKRTHHVSFDGAEISSFDAWRTDCGELCTITENPLPLGPDKYCLENPCGLIASVQAARANWCPGDVVAPLRGPVFTALKPGPDHEFGFVVDDVYPGGSWTVSATLYAYGP
jgi:hypothetical protein